LVVYEDSIRLFDATMLDQLTSIDLSGFSKIYINDTCKFVQGNLPGLMKQITEFLPGGDFSNNKQLNIVTCFSD